MTRDELIQAARTAQALGDRVKTRELTDLLRRLDAPETRVIPNENVYQIVFEASGTVGKGDGPDALDVPTQEMDDN